MARRKNKNGVRKLFYIDESNFLWAKNKAHQLDMTVSCYIDYLIQKELIHENPLAEINSLQFEVEKKRAELAEIEKRQGEKIDYLKFHEDMKKQRQENIQQAILILRRKFINNDSKEEIEKVAKWHGLRLGVDAFELVYLATKHIENDVALPQINGK